MTDPKLSQITAKVTRAAALLRAQGWTVTPPVPPAPRRIEPDQCEYPDLRSEPGDTCTNHARRKRHTRHGWLWLCSEHIACPASELFDERLACHAE